MQSSTSSLGSFGWKDHFAYVPSAPYKCTKAALNMLTVQSSAELSKDGITVFAISPGVSVAPLEMYSKIVDFSIVGEN